MALPAIAGTHTIDGNLNDWGVNLQKAYSGDDSGWIPKNHPSVDWIVENNRDPNIGSSDWTGYKSTGYHYKIDVLTRNIIPYSEPLVNNYVEPAGGEPFDIEALYFDDNKSNVFISIVTSMNQSGYFENSSYESGSNRFTEAGDIALDLDNNASTGQYGYEYGIITHPADNLLLGHVIYNPKWTLPQWYEGLPDNAPSTCELGPNSIDEGKTTLVYKKSDTKETVDYGYKGLRVTDNYIIEANIPKNMIGNPSNNTLSNIHIAMGCGNDAIELKPVKFKEHEIPEFPSIVLPVAAIVGIMFVFGNRKKNV